MAETIKLPRASKLVPLSRITPYDRNPRRHSADQIEKVAASIREFGFTNPVLVDENLQLLAGHGRLEAARLLGMSSVPAVEIVGLTEAQKRAYVIADNRLPLDATWDPGLLQRELEALEVAGYDVALTGFEVAELLDFLEPEEDAKPKLEPPVPAPPERPVSRSGDLWLLGEHRLLCGDSTKAEDVARLLGGRLADCCWTDPPYNVAYEGTPVAVAEGGGRPIANDDLPAVPFGIFLRTAFRNAWRNMADGASIYVAHADTEGLTFRHQFQAAGFFLSGCLIWAKDALVLGRSDYQWRHEPILYGWKPGAAHRWFGGRAETTLLAMPESPFLQTGENEWQITLGDQTLIITGERLTVRTARGSVLSAPKPKRNAEDPTMKPVSLIRQMLANSARAGEVVLDLFGGSGSTLMACQDLDLLAAVVELEPRYVDVIIRRWEAATKLDAVLSGERRPPTFSKVKAARAKD